MKHIEIRPAMFPHQQLQAPRVARGLLQLMATQGLLASRLAFLQETICPDGVLSHLLEGIRRFITTALFPRVISFMKQAIKQMSVLKDL
jgi:hypothetical protein